MSLDQHTMPLPHSRSETAAIVVLLAHVVLSANA